MNFQSDKDFDSRGLSHDLPFLIPIFHPKNDISINELRTMKSNFQKVKDETKAEDSRPEVWISRKERISPVEESERNCREKISFVGNFMNDIGTRVKNFTFGVSDGRQSVDFNDSSDKISFHESPKVSNVNSTSSNSQLIFSSPSLHSLASLTVNCYKSNTEIQFNSSSDIYSPSMVLSEDVSSSAAKSKSNSKRSLTAEDVKNGSKERLDLSCSLCSFSGASTEEMNGHLQIIHSTFRCLVCNFTSKSQARLNRHLMENHDQDGEMDLQRRKREVKKAKRLRRYSCKQCTFTTSVQEEIWMHTRVHVPASKLLSCPRCPFVCAFKHHMQYHLNNHFGYKPYKCELCNYRCNNKSMLNSHLKSHSSDYPFKCDKCSYATKYRQALYIHSSKANHSPDEKSKSGSDILNIRLKWNKTPTSQRALSSDDEMKDVGSMDDLSYWEKVRSPLRSVGNGNNTYQTADQEDANEYRNDFNSNNFFELKNVNPEKFHPVTSSFNSLITSLLPYQRSDMQAWSLKPGKNPSDAKDFEDNSSSPIDLSTNKSRKDASHENENVVKKCDHCSIIFEDSTLFWCHMTCHSPDSPFKCNLCGKKTRDKVEFFVHLCEVGHQPNVSKTCFPTEMSNQEF